MPSGGSLGPRGQLRLRRGGGLRGGRRGGGLGHVHQGLEQPEVVAVHGVERAHGLPTARRQARRRHGSRTRYLDNLYEEYGLCVELDGNAAHPAEGRWRDTRRDNANLAQGARTLRYGWPDVTEHRCRTAAEIAAILRSQGWTGTLRRCGPSCTATPAQKTQKPQKRC